MIKGGKIVVVKKKLKIMCNLRGLETYKYNHDTGDDEVYIIEQEDKDFTNEELYNVLIKLDAFKQNRVIELVIDFEMDFKSIISSFNKFYKSKKSRTSTRILTARPNHILVSAEKKN